MDRGHEDIVATQHLACSESFQSSLVQQTRHAGTRDCRHHLIVLNIVNDLGQVGRGAFQLSSCGVTVGALRTRVVFHDRLPSF